MFSSDLSAPSASSLASRGCLQDLIIPPTMIEAAEDDTSVPKILAETKHKVKTQKKELQHSRLSFRCLENIS